jgi:hypothetical protein
MSIEPSDWLSSNPPTFTLAAAVSMSMSVTSVSADSDSWNGRFRTSRAGIHLFVFPGLIRSDGRSRPDRARPRSSLELNGP